MIRGLMGLVLVDAFWLFGVVCSAAQWTSLGEGFVFSNGIKKIHTD